MKKYPLKNNVSKEEFKYLIISQLKDPDSAFCCLLMATNKEDALLSSSNNFKRDNIVFAASEFNLKLTFSWDSNIVHKSSRREKFPLDNGGHTVIFEDMDDGSMARALDLTRADWLNQYEFSQERIFECPNSDDDGFGDSGDFPSLIGFGAVKFTITHNDYIFEREYYTEVSGEAQYNVKTCQFENPSRHYFSTDILESHFYRASKRTRDVYLQLSLKDLEIEVIKKVISDSGADEITQEKVFKIITETVNTGTERTRMTCIMVALAEPILHLDSLES